MHHAENNQAPYDYSSTNPYQRDSLVDFLKYWLNFVIGTWVELPYLAIVKHGGLMSPAFWNIVVVIFTYWGFVALLWQANYIATIYLFLLPFFTASLALMFGNWSQHVFVDPKRPTSNYALTYNCMNTIENQYTWNDGYHIVHHIAANLHWSEMPLYFKKNLGKFEAKDAITFDNLGFFDVGLYVMLGRYDKLCQHYVHLTPKGKKRRTDAELVEMFKERLKPIPTK